MKTFYSMGEAMLLAHEGERMMARAIADGARRLARKALAWLGARRAAAGQEG